MILTVAVAGVSEATPTGRLAPKPKSTLSSSSSTVSSAMVMVKVSEVSPDTKVTFAGAPE